MTLAARCLFFLQLLEYFAPLINTIWVLFYEIRYFMIIMFMYYCPLVMAYYLIGRNQLLIDNLEIENAPKYSSWYGAPKYVFMSVMYQDFKVD